MTATPAPRAGAEARYLVFALAGQRLALPHAAVREVLPLPHLGRPPGLPGVVAGFVDLGGRPAAVLALAPLLGLPPGPPVPEGGLYRHIILLHPPAPGLGPTGLLVDRALDLATAGPWHPLPPEQSLNGCVAGGLALGEEMVPVLDAARLLLAGEQAALAELTRRAEARMVAWEPEPPAPGAGPAP